MIARALGILALLLLAVGLLAGTAGSGRAMAQPHHQHHQGAAAQAAEPCAGDVAVAQAPCDGDHAVQRGGGGLPAHQHGKAGCICAVGACDLSLLPDRLEAVAYTHLAGLPPAAERMPPARDPAPPLKPPRA